MCCSDNSLSIPTRIGSTPLRIQKFNNPESQVLFIESTVDAK